MLHRQAVDGGTRVAENQPRALKNGTLRSERCSDSLHFWHMCLQRLEKAPKAFLIVKSRIRLDLKRLALFQLPTAAVRTLWPSVSEKASSRDGSG